MLRQSFLYFVILFLGFFFIACSGDQDNIPKQQSEPCTQLSATEIQNASNPIIGNWRWVKSQPAGLAEKTPASEGYEECWVFMPNDSLMVCRADTVFVKIKASIEFKLNPTTKQDSVFTIFNTGVITFKNDTMQIFDSWVDGTDYWLVRNCK
jgi:hypothetical protein